MDHIQSAAPRVPLSHGSHSPAVPTGVAATFQHSGGKIRLLCLDFYCLRLFVSSSSALNLGGLESRKPRVPTAMLLRSLVSSPEAVPDCLPYCLQIALLWVVWSLSLSEGWDRESYLCLEARFHPLH